MIASGRRDVKSTISTGPFSTSLFVCLPEGKSQVFFGVVPEWALTCFEAWPWYSYGNPGIWT